MAGATDEQLMDSFRRGQAGAFEELYERHARKVYSFLARMCGDRTLAEDLLQATFLSVVRSRDRYGEGLRFAPWLYSIAANAARDAARRRTRAREDELGAEHEPAAPERKGDSALARRLEGALALLPLAQREAVVLHHLDEWTFDEMSEALGTSTAALRVRAHRGYEKLRELLGDLEESA